jgi:HEAT repeat protein
MGIFYELFKPSPQKLGRKKNVQGLMKILKKEEDRKLREEAVEALAMIGGSRTIEPLIFALADNNKWVRLKAAKILKTLKDPKTIEPFIQALKDEDRDVRGVAVKALGSFGDVRVVRPLINLGKDEDRHIRWFAGKALIEVLGKIKDIKALEQLHQIYEDNSIYKSPATKDAFKAALFELGWEPKRNSEKARLLINKGNWELDEMVSLGTAAVNSLIQAIRKERFGGSLEMKALGMIGDKRAIKPLLKKFAWGSNAAEALGMIRNWSSEELELLVIALNGNKGEVRHSAAKALGLIGDLRTAEAVINSLFNFEKHSSFAIKKDGFALEDQFGKDKMKNLLGRYSRHILNSSLGFFVRVEFGHFGTRYIWTVSRSDNAVEDLCNIPTQISNNILIKVINRKKITVHDHSPDEAFGHGLHGHYKELDLSKQKMMAKKELEKRGNPNYESSVYLEKKEWKL